jgi:flagellar hook protein FlgE
MAFNTAISGLNAASSDLGVIGNNISNSSTTGFKAARAEFADVYPASNLGTSANAIGAGVTVAAVKQQFTQGNISYTNNNLDLAINGQGFFRLSDNGTILYTRAGAFEVDRAGYLSNNKGLHLTGYLADSAGNITGTLGDLQLSSANIAPNATATVDVGLNLDASAVVPATTPFNPADPTSYNNATSLTVYDSLGGAHTATMYFLKAAANTWDSYLYVDGTQVTHNGGATTPVVLTFNGNGSLATVNGSAASAVTFDNLALGNGAAPLGLTLDFGAATPTTQYGGAFSVNALTQDGYATGRLSGVDIGQTGVVYARYSNGQSRALGQVVLSNFSNPQGLRPLGDTNWAESFDSGAALTGAPGTSNLGVIQSGALEESNVNLTEQLVHMIIAQRNFQANAQMITTEDAITQTIINIR